jgi:hypothetical protein
MGDPDIAAVFNRHASAETTEMYYNRADPNVTFEAISSKVDVQRKLDETTIPKREKSNKRIYLD